jgi:putative toxin-antitoxin system antitoxin component (TIGR02293 family)
MAEPAPVDLDSLLGLRRLDDTPVSALALIDGIEKGLPVASLKAVSEAFSPNDKSFMFRFVPKATLARRLATHRLRPEEGERLVRFARVWQLAREVWQDDTAARAFLRRPHPLLGGREPLELMLLNSEGAKLVEDILGRLKYGSAA